MKIRPFIGCIILSAMAINSYSSDHDDQKMDNHKIENHKIEKHKIEKHKIESHKIESHSKTVQALSPDLRVLLSQEMRAIEEGMRSTFSHIIAGDMKAVSATALSIKNSYILKKKLSEAQRHELHSTLPTHFIEQDKQFHYSAGMLSHAADMGKSELVEFYYTQMLEQCVQCHRTHAQHRFPLLREKQEDHGHHH